MTGGNRAVLDHLARPVLRDHAAEGRGDVDDIAAYQAELVVTRANAAAWLGLDVPVRGLRNGKQVNLRLIVTHLIEEYARHVGT